MSEQIVQAFHHLGNPDQVVVRFRTRWQRQQQLRIASFDIELIDLGQQVYLLFVQRQASLFGKSHQIMNWWSEVLALLAYMGLQNLLNRQMREKEPMANLVLPDKIQCHIPILCSTVSPISYLFADIDHARPATLVLLPLNTPLAGKREGISGALDYSGQSKLAEGPCEKNHFSEAM
jgi:hypothetical protein